MHRKLKIKKEKKNIKFVLSPVFGGIFFSSITGGTGFSF
jgi:hypothetical protein